MQIRRLLVSDAPAYRALRLRALREHPDAFTSSFEEESAKALAVTEKRLDPAGPTKLWGVFAQDSLVGMVGLDPEQRIKNRHKATLIGMYVAPEHTGHGAGRLLVEALLEDARASGLALIVLTVTQGNRSARELYARAGFSTFGIEPDAVRVGGLSFAKEHMYLQLTPP